MTFNTVGINCNTVLALHSNDFSDEESTETPHTRMQALTHSLIHSLSLSLSLSHTHTHTHVHSPKHTHTHTYTHTLTCTHPLTHASTPTLTHNHTFYVYSYIPALHQWPLKHEIRRQSCLCVLGVLIAKTYPYSRDSSRHNQLTAQSIHTHTHTHITLS